MWHEVMKVIDLSVLAWLGGPNLTKKTWPKVHFASFIMCIMLTHDDVNDIYPFLGKNSIYDLCIVKANDLYKFAKFKLKTPFFKKNLWTFINKMCFFNSQKVHSVILLIIRCIVFINTFPP
jgi:hypothetical protein